MQITSAASAASVSSSSPSGQPRLLALMMSLFFAFGFCTVLVDTLVPKLKAMFALSYAEVMLTQFCFFAAYFVISIPAGWLLGKIGYLRGITLGLAVMAGGCLMFTPAASLGVYPGFLLALFVLASGVTVVQVAANPLTSSLGDPKKSSSRLTLAQAFNSLATMVGPIVGATFILANSIAGPDPKTATAGVLAAYRIKAAQSVQLPFIAIAVALLGLAAICWIARRWEPPADVQPPGSLFHLLGRPRLALGAVSIFAYVGAEVSIGSAIANYLMLSSTLSANAQTAGSLVSVYWGLAMVGRFIGSAVLRKVPAGAALMVCAAGAGLLASASALSTGSVAAAALLTVGLFNSIQFPTIFTVAIEDLGDETAQGSGLVCLAIVGGAVVPILTGLSADRFGLPRALFVPVICYVWIVTYGALTQFGFLPASRGASAPALGPP